MNLTVDLAPVEQKPVFRNMLELYLHDLSEFTGFDLGEHGLFGYNYLDHYWLEADRFPFLVRVDERLAGFVFVRTDDLETSPRFSVAEFFIMRKYRRHGIGESVARDVFRRFPGQWSLAVDLRNEAGLPFWRRTVGRFTEGRFTEHPGNTPHRIVLHFAVHAPGQP